MIKKCPYCNFKLDKYGILAGSEWHEKDIHHAIIFLSSKKTVLNIEQEDGDSASAYINYCPWCGRRLSNENS